MNKRYQILSGSALKIIAMVTMLIDHVGAIIIENGFLASYNAQAPNALTYQQMTHLMNADIVLRMIGRIAFPIFCFLLLEGFMHTSNRRKYAIRLFLFALLSEIPFDIAFQSSLLEFTYQNVMFTLFIGLLIMMLLDKFKGNYHIMVLTIAAGLGLGYLLHADYDYRGVIFIVVIYLFRHNKVLQTVTGCVSLLWEAPACFSFIPIRLYNGKRGLSLKYVFYFFYPVHILILCIIRYFIC